jgi:hypothetical protein
MYALRLVCPPEEVDRVTGALWEAGTLGIQEIAAPGTTVLLAVFEKPIESGELIASLERLKPVWQALPPTDWAEQTRRAWPGRAIGNRLFLAAPWSAEETPAGRLRVMHNPGLACGTGEHPCTQLALEALETHVTPMMWWPTLELVRASWRLLRFFWARALLWAQIRTKRRFA